MEDGDGTESTEYNTDPCSRVSPVAKYAARRTFFSVAASQSARTSFPKQPPAREKDPRYCLYRAWLSQVLVAVSCYARLGGERKAFPAGRRRPPGFLGSNDAYGKATEPILDIAFVFLWASFKRFRRAGKNCAVLYGMEMLFFFLFQPAF